MWEENEEIGDVENLDETSCCVHVTCWAMPETQEEEAQTTFHAHTLSTGIDEDILPLQHF